MKLIKFARGASVLPSNLPRAVPLFYRVLRHAQGCQRLRAPSFALQPEGLGCNIVNSFAAQLSVLAAASQTCLAAACVATSVGTASDATADDSSMQAMFRGHPVFGEGGPGPAATSAAFATALTSEHWLELKSLPLSHC